MLVRDGADGARKKIVVETFDGAPVLSTPFADVLQKAGFVRLPDGMRLLRGSLRPLSLSPAHEERPAGCLQGV